MILFVDHGLKTLVPFLPLEDNMEGNIRKTNIIKLSNFIQIE